MLANFIRGIHKFTSVIGVEVMMLPGDQLALYSMQLSIEKGFVITGQTLSDITDVGTFAKEVDKDIPIWLSLSGRGVLHKKVDLVSDDHQKNVQVILPNARPEEFYIQRFPTDNEFNLSIIRRKTFHDILDTFTKEGLFVAGVTLGPFPLQGIIPLLGSMDSKVQLGGHSFEIEEGQIKQYSFTQAPYLTRKMAIEKESIAENLVVAYATGLQSLLSVAPLQVVVNAIDEARIEFAHKRIFKIAGLTVLGFFLGILLLNFVLYTQYQSRYTYLSGIQSKASGFKMNFDSLQKKVLQRELFLERSGWMKPSRISYYSDQIGGSVPSSIILLEMSFNPLQEGLTRTEKKLVFESGTIAIAGSCSKPTDLNPWVGGLKAMPWVKTVEMQNYVYDNSANKGFFLITILVNK